MFVSMCFDVRNNTLDFGGSLKIIEKKRFLFTLGGYGDIIALKGDSSQN